jgi:hypothetical protein
MTTALAEKTYLVGVTTALSSIFQFRPSIMWLKPHIWEVAGSDNCTLLHLSTQTLQQVDKKTTYLGGVTTVLSSIF